MVFHSYSLDLVLKSCCPDHMSLSGCSSSSSVKDHRPQSTLKRSCSHITVILECMLGYFSGFHSPPNSDMDMFFNVRM